MTMKAILLVPENFDTIEADRDFDISIPELQDVYERRSAHPFNETHYFIPDYVTINGYETHGWVCCRQDYMDESFSYDKEKIKTEFVPIIRG